MKEVKKSKETKRRAVSVHGIIKAIANWLRRWVLPVVSTVALAGLAIKGVMAYLPALNESASLVVAIVAVVMLLATAIDRE